jgi:hypothetical protein
MGRETLSNLLHASHRRMDVERSSASTSCGGWAHPIRKTSAANRFIRASFRLGRHQVDELLSAARAPIPAGRKSGPAARRDGHRPGRHCSRRGARHSGEEDPPRRPVLPRGSLEFIDWAGPLPELRQAGRDAGTDKDTSYAFQFRHLPHELDGWLQGRQAEGYGARITAAGLLVLEPPRPDGSLVFARGSGDRPRP